MFLRNQFKGVGMFRLPLIKKQNIKLDSAKFIGYDKINQNSDFSKIVHFYLDDYKFEDIYSKPDKKLALLKKFKAVLTPDFSMYLEMPLPLQLYAAFKSRWVGAYLQSQGVKVIPTVRWADLTSFNYCFDGIEKGSIVAVSTVGTKKEKAHFMLGYNEMYSRIKPSMVICYGKPYPEMKGNIIFVDYSETNHSKSNNDTGYIKKVYGYITNNDIKGGGSAGGGEQRTLPMKGKPNSKKARYKNGKKVQEREYDENGNPKRDIDYTDHGNPKEHPNVPHQHKWENGKRGKADELL